MSRAATTIGNLLVDVAENHDVQILKAKDYGSRARSLESERSDFDVFFVFCQPYVSYLLRSDYVDVIEENVPPTDSDLDVDVELHGWNLRKFLGGEDLHGNNGGLLGSDAMAMEVVASDVEYYTAPSINGAWESLEEYAASAFKPYALINHYESLAKGNYRKYLEERDGTTTDVTIKRYNNVLQALMKRFYIERTKSLPPMDANDLLREMAGEIDDVVYANIGDLFAQKRGGSGEDRPPEGVRSGLDTWIEDELERAVDPDGYVDRRPDPEKMAEHVKQIVEDRC